MDRVIKVKGKAVHYVKPDMQRLEFNFSQLLEKYEMCLEIFDKMHKAIINSFKKQGFDTENLKTTKFDIDKNFVYFDDKVGKKTYRKKEFAGYELKVAYSLETPLDVKELVKQQEAINEVFNDYKTKEFSMNTSYFIKDMERVNNELLKDAVKNAMSKAQVLAEASNEKLGSIQMIDYSYDRIRIYNNSGHCNDDVLLCEMSISDYKPSIISENIEIFVKDIKTEAEVDLVYGIE